MPAILKIGYTQYLIKTESGALAALKALSDAVPVRWEYVDHKKVYFPDESSNSEKEIELTIVKHDQFRVSKRVRTPETIPAERQLQYEGKVFYQGDGKEGK